MYSHQLTLTIIAPPSVTSVAITTTALPVHPFPHVVLDRGDDHFLIPNEEFISTSITAPDSDWSPTVVLSQLYEILSPSQCLCQWWCPPHPQWCETLSPLPGRILPLRLGPSPGNLLSSGREYSVSWWPQTVPGTEGPSWQIMFHIPSLPSVTSCTIWNWREMVSGNDR